MRCSSTAMVTGPLSLPLRTTAPTDASRMSQPVSSISSGVLRPNICRNRCGVMVSTPRFRSDRNVGATNWFLVHIASDMSSMSASVYLALEAVDASSDMAGSSVLRMRAYSAADYRACAVMRSHG